MIPPTSSRSTTPEEMIESLLNDAQSIRHVDYPRVVELGTKALNLADKINHVPYQSRSLSMIAWGMVCQKKYDQSLQYAMQALTYALDHQLLYEEGMASNVLAVNYADNHNMSEALQYYLRQLELGGQLDNREFQSNSLNDIGIIYLQLDDYLTGIHYLEESIDFIDLVKNQETMEHTLTYMSLSEAYFHTDNLPIALDYAKKALAICQREESPIWLSRVQALIGQILSKQGNYETALQSLEKSLSLAEESKHRDCLVRSYYSWGDFYLAQDDYTQALAHYTQAIGYLTEPRSNKALMLEILKKTSDIHEKLGDYERAFRNYKRHHEIEQLINREQLRQQVQLAFASYEASKRAEVYRHKSEQLEMEIEIQKRSEVERMERERLQFSLKKERDLAQVKEKILTRIGHEFRTPLSVIQASVQILELYYDKLTPDRRSHHYNLILSEITDIDRLLKNILSVLKSDVPTINEQLPSDDIHTTCEQAIITAYQTSGRKQTIHRVIEAEVESIEFHPAFIYNILVQVLSNALKYSKDEVYLRVFKQDNNLVLQIEDSGIGIPADEHELIFEPLHRGSNIDEVSGAGLGLTIVNNYVTIYGGHINIISEVDKGTCLSVILPI